MTITVSLPREIEFVLRQQAEAAGQDIETFVRHIVTESVSFNSENQAAPSQPTSREEFTSRLRAIIRGHGICCGGFDDSRETIYAGRGE